MSRSSRGGRSIRRRRIGFILANIHTGSANTIWPALVDEAESHQVDLFIFPGGRLVAREDRESLRNNVFTLANPRSVDGLLSWASAIGSSVSIEVLERFHSFYSSLPTITLNQKINDLPLNTIDSYSGMRKLMDHLLDVHGFRRIAYIHGPPAHPAARERYQALRDSLKEREIPFDSRLVTSPRPWDSGRESLIELLDERDLHPSRDFDILVAASDLLLFDAVCLLQKRGYQIPGECPVAGFNDSIESRMLSPAFTTVRMPFEEQSIVAFHSLLDLLDGKPIPDVVRLPTRLIVRQSCGCIPSSIDILRKDPTSFPPDGKALEDSSEPGNESLIADILEQLQGGHEDRVAWIEPLINAFLATCRKGNPNEFLDTLQRILTHVMQMSREIHVWEDVISVLRMHYYASHPGGLDVFMENLFNQARLLVSGTLHTAYTFKQWHDGRLLRTLGNLDKDLLAVRDRKLISEILSRHLPALDIRSAYLVINEPPRSGAESFSRLIAGFQTGSTDGIARPLTLSGSGEAFPTSQLLPGSCFPEKQAGSYMVQPLMIDDRLMGYIVLRIGLKEGYIYEEIRGILSSALNGMFLFEETGRAREIAERAEQLKTLFLVNLSSELRTPLENIVNLGRSIKSLLEHGRDLASARSLLETITGLARKQLRATDDLLDLALTQVKDLELHREVVDPLRLLSEAAETYEKESNDRKIRLDLPARLPLIEADRARLCQVLAILLGRVEAVCMDGTVQLEARLAPPFLDVSIVGRRSKNKSQGSEPALESIEGIALTLARNLTVLHGGVLDILENGGPKFGFLLHHPLPNLGGFDAHARCTGSDTVLVLSSRGIIPHEAITLKSNRKYRVHAVNPGTLLQEKELLHDSPTLIWDPASSEFADWSFIRAFRRSEGCLRLPCAVFPDSSLSMAAVSGGALSLNRLIDAAAANRMPGPVIVLDSDEQRRSATTTEIGGLSGIEDIVGMDNIDHLVILLHDYEPSLIILNDLNEALIRSLRSIPRVSDVPMIILIDSILSWEEISWSADIPKIVVYNRGILKSAEMIEQVEALRRGKIRMLPPHTSCMVKKAILYINLNVSATITRWKLADAIHVSEDYLTRIFHKETGISPWEYLNRYRVHVAGMLLKSSNDTIKTVAAQAGFQDQTYFCRVFRSIAGLSPREFRMHPKEHT
jgi:DNA-binding LacI/PurR family transcriptional regulator/AraC-like DNA-binding protein/signal transduction histidine kinase